MSYNVRTEQEVRDMYATLKSKGVKMLKEPTLLPIGLFFYFEDVEGNIIEVAHNSYIPLDEDFNAVDHKPIDHL